MNRSQGTMHGAAPPFMPGWPPKTPHELYSHGFQGLKPLTSVTSSVPSFSLADHPVTHREPSVPTGWPNGYKNPLGMGPRGSPFHGEVGISKDQPRQSPNHHEMHQQHSSTNIQGSNTHTGYTKINEAPQMGCNQEIPRNFHSNILNGYSKSSSNFSSHNQDSHPEIKLGDHSTAFHIQDSVSSYHGRLRPYEEPGKAYSKFYGDGPQLRNLSSSPSVFSSQGQLSRSDGTVTPKPMDRYHLGDMSSSRFTPHISTAGHPLSTSDSLKTVNSNGTSQSMISHPQPRDKVSQPNSFHSQKDPAVASLTSNHKASKVAAEIFAEAQSSMLQTNTGNILPSFSNISNMMSYKKPHQGYLPFDHENIGKVQMDSRPENNLSQSKFQNSPNTFQNEPLSNSFWSQFRGVAPNISLDDKGMSQRKNSAFIANGEVRDLGQQCSETKNSLGQKCSQKKTVENTKPQRTIKDMVEEKRTEKHKKRNSHEDPNISKLVDAKVQEILAAYKEKELQRHQNLLKPKQSKTPPKNMAPKESHLEAFHMNVTKPQEYNQSVSMTESGEKRDNGAHEMETGSSRKFCNETEKHGSDTLNLHQQVMDMRMNRRETLDKSEAQRPQSVSQESSDTKFAHYHQDYKSKKHGPNTPNLYQQVMDMRMNRKETLDKSNEDRPRSISDQRQNTSYTLHSDQQDYNSEKPDHDTQGLHPQTVDMRTHGNDRERSQTDMSKGMTELSRPVENPQHHDFFRPSSEGKHPNFLSEKMNEPRYLKKQQYDHPQEAQFYHQHFSHHPSQLYYQQGWQYGHTLQQQVDEMRTVKRERRLSGEHATHGSELLAGRKTPCCGNCKELGTNFSKNCVNHQSDVSSRMIDRSVNNGLNLSMKKDPYKFDAVGERMGSESFRMTSLESMHHNGSSSMQGHLQKHVNSKFNAGTGVKNFHRMELPYNKPSQGLYFSKKTGSKHLGYKTSLSLLKKSHKYNGKYTGKFSLPGKKTGKVNHTLVRPTGRPSGKMKTKDKFAENLMKNLGFPPLTKSDLKSLCAPKFNIKYLNGHSTKELTFKKEPNMVPGISNSDQKNVLVKNVDVCRMNEDGAKLNSEIKKPLEFCNRQKEVKGLLPRSKSVDLALASSCKNAPLLKSRSLSLNDVRIMSELGTTSKKAVNFTNNLQDKEPMDASRTEVQNITNHVQDLKRLVTGQLSDYSHELETNTVVSVPQCGCLGPDHMFNEAVEGPYYTHLGAGRSVEAIRLLLENRTGTEGKAIRIEKLRYTGKEGRSSQGCPIAKWIIRRSSSDEKYLALVRHRPGHFCETAWLVIGLVAWEGVPTNQADDLYSYLTETLPDNGLETERRCGTNDRKTCACQGIDLKKRGASFSFGCSWSMYFNGCKFARSQVARKFRLKSIEQEPKLEEKLQNLATHLAPLYKQCAPQAHYNQCYFSEKAQDCRLGHERPGPFSGVTACADFCAHAHKDIHNMNNGSTVVVTLTKHRGLSKPDDEQLHVLPLYVLEPTDETGSYDAQYDKIQSGALEVLHHYPLEARVRSQPLESCRKRRLNKKSPGKKRGSPGKDGLSHWNGSSSSNQSTPKKVIVKREMALTDSPASNMSFSSQSGSAAGTPVKRHFQPSISEGSQPTRPDPSKMKHIPPGLEGLYEKFFDYFEANGSFPPPAFMAQYARARQMLLKSGGEMDAMNKSHDHLEGQTKCGGDTQANQTEMAAESTSNKVIDSLKVSHDHTVGQTEFGGDTQPTQAKIVTQPLSSEGSSKSSIYNHVDILSKRQQTPYSHGNELPKQQQLIGAENGFPKDCVSQDSGNVPVLDKSEYTESYQSMSYGTGAPGNREGSATSRSFAKSDLQLIHQNGNIESTTVETFRGYSQDYLDNMSVQTEHSSQVTRSTEHSFEADKSFEHTLEAAKSSKHSPLVVTSTEDSPLAVRSDEHCIQTARFAGHSLVAERSAEHSQLAERSKHSPLVVRSGKEPPLAVRSVEHSIQAARSAEHSPVVVRSAEEPPLAVRSTEHSIQAARSAYLCQVSDHHKEDHVAVTNPFSDNINPHKPASPHGSVIMKSWQGQLPLPDNTDKSNPHTPVTPHGNVIAKLSLEQQSFPCSNLHKPVPSDGSFITESRQGSLPYNNNNNSSPPHKPLPPHGNVIMKSLHEQQSLPFNNYNNPHKQAPPHGNVLMKSSLDQFYLPDNNDNINPHKSAPSDGSYIMKSSMDHGCLPDNNDNNNPHKSGPPHGNVITQSSFEQQSVTDNNDKINPHKPLPSDGRVVMKSWQEQCPLPYNNDKSNHHQQVPSDGHVVMKSWQEQCPLPYNNDKSNHLKQVPSDGHVVMKSWQEQCPLPYNNDKSNHLKQVPSDGHVIMKPSMVQGPPTDNIPLTQQGSIEKPQISAMDLSSTTSSKGSINEQGPQPTIHPLTIPSYQGEHVPHFGSSNQQGQHSLTQQSPLHLLSDSASALKEESHPKNESSPLNLSRNGLQITNRFPVSFNQRSESDTDSNVQRFKRDSQENKVDEREEDKTKLINQNITTKAATPYPHVSNGQFHGQKYLQTPCQSEHTTESQHCPETKLLQNVSDKNAYLFNSASAESQGHFDSERNDYHNFHSNEQRRSQMSWNMFNYSPQKLPSHQYPSAMTNGQFPKTEISSESSIDPNIVKCRMEYNEEAFRDPNIGGVAVALNHGAVLFEVAKRELHATTGLKNPNRFRPTRISLVFYQHKNLNNERHGMYAYAKKLENMKQERIARMKEQRGFVDMEEIENSFKGGKKRKLEDMKSPDEEEYDIMKTSAAHYRYMLECNAKRQESLTTSSYSTKWVKPQPMVTGPYQKWV